MAALRASTSPYAGYYGSPVDSCVAGFKLPPPVPPARNRQKVQYKPVQAHIPADVPTSKSTPRQMPRYSGRHLTLKVQEERGTPKAKAE
jgi:hypothetical protein